MRSLLWPLPKCCPGSQAQVGPRESANPAGKAAEIFVFSPSCTGDDEGVTTPSNDVRRGQRSPESLLIGDDGFSEKGTTPESGGGNRNSGRRRGLTPAKTCTLPPVLSTPTPVLTRAMRLSRRCFPQAKPVAKAS